MQNHGIRGEQVRIDWPELMRFKQSFTDPVPKQREDGFARAGIDAFQGRARFVGPSAVQVGDDLLDARHVVVATGQRPATLKIQGAEHVITSDRFLELDSLPRSIVFIGGGYISFEFAHVAARAGVQVALLHRSCRPLVRFDPDLVGKLVERTRDLGVDVRLETQPEAIEKDGKQLIVRTSMPSGKQDFEADIVVHGAGRVAEIDDLNLDKAGIEWDERGVKVNQYLQSVSNSSVYAAGDAAASGGPPLTPVAGYEGQIVAANLLEGNHRKADYSGIPTVVFTTPPLAAVGLDQSAARDQGLRFKLNYEDTSRWYSSRRVNEKCSAFKVLVEEDTGRILGAHLLRSHADELINFFALAIRLGLRATDLKEMLFAYPTHASDIKYML
jgi:glutathione reductase (NADPH)